MTSQRSIPVKDPGTHLIRRVSFMRLFKKIYGLDKHQICGGKVRKYGAELLETIYAMSFHGDPDKWMVPICC